MALLDRYNPGAALANPEQRIAEAMRARQNQATQALQTQGYGALFNQSNLDPTQNLQGLLANGNLFSGVNQTAAAYTPEQVTQMQMNQPMRMGDTSTYAYQNQIYQNPALTPMQMYNALTPGMQQQAAQGAVNAGSGHFRDVNMAGMQVPQGAAQPQQQGTLRRQNAGIPGYSGGSNGYSLTGGAALGDSYGISPFEMNQGPIGGPRGGPWTEMRGGRGSYNGVSNPYGMGGDMKRSAGMVDNTMEYGGMQYPYSPTTSAPPGVNSAPPGAGVSGETWDAWNGTSPMPPNPRAGNPGVPNWMTGAGVGGRQPMQQPGSPGAPGSPSQMPQRMFNLPPMGLFNYGQASGWGSPYPGWGSSVTRMF